MVIKVGFHSSVYYVQGWRSLDDVFVRNWGLGGGGGSKFVVVGSAGGSSGGPTSHRPVFRTRDIHFALLSSPHTSAL